MDRQEKGLRQDIETGCSKWSVVRFLGVLFLKGNIILCNWVLSINNWGNWCFIRFIVFQSVCISFICFKVKTTILSYSSFFDCFCHCFLWTLVLLGEPGCIQLIQAISNEKISILISIFWYSLYLTRNVFVMKWALPKIEVAVWYTTNEL